MSEASRGGQGEIMQERWAGSMWPGHLGYRRVCILFKQQWEIIAG